MGLDFDFYYSLHKGALHGDCIDLLSSLSNTRTQQLEFLVYYLNNFLNQQPSFASVYKRIVSMIIFYSKKFMFNYTTANFSLYFRLIGFGLIDIHDCAIFDNINKLLFLSDKNINADIHYIISALKNETILEKENYFDIQIYTPELFPYSAFFGNKLYFRDIVIHSAYHDAEILEKNLFRLTYEHRVLCTLLCDDILLLSTVKEYINDHLIFASISQLFNAVNFFNYNPYDIIICGILSLNFSILQSLSLDSLSDDMFIYNMNKYSSEFFKVKRCNISFPFYDLSDSSLSEFERLIGKYNEKYILASYVLVIMFVFDFNEFSNGDMDIFLRNHEIETIETRVIFRLDFLLGKMTKKVDFENCFFNCNNLKAIHYDFNSTKNLKDFIESLGRDTYFFFKRESTNFIEYHDKLKERFVIKDYFDGIRNSIYLSYKDKNCEIVSSNEVIGINKLNEIYDQVYFLNLFGDFSIVHYDSFFENHSFSLDKSHNLCNIREIDLSLICFSNIMSFKSMFCGCYKLRDIKFGISSDTLNVTDMSYMFYDCIELETVDLSSLSTQCLTNMKCMFYNCKSMKKIIFGEVFNTSNVTDMSFLFCNCSNISIINLECFDTSNVVDMCCMFGGCLNLKTIIYGSQFNTSKVVDFSYLFFCCNSFTKIDLTPISVANSIDLKYMFYGCSGLDTLDLSTFDTFSVTDMSYMFCGCSNLNMLDISSLNTSNVINMSYMFKGCCKLINLDLSSFNTTNVKYMSNMFNGCSKISEINLSSFTTLNVVDMHGMFSECSAVKYLNLSSFDLCSLVNMSKMFKSCDNLKSLDISSFGDINLDSTEICYLNLEILSISSISIVNYLNNNATEQFNSLSYLIVKKENLDELKNMNVGNKKYNLIISDNPSEHIQILESIKLNWIIEDMFYDDNLCVNIVYKHKRKKTIKEEHIQDLIQLQNYYKYISLSKSFKECENLKKISFPSKFNTFKIIDISSMFESCHSIKSINISSLNTTLVKDMSSMFCDCKNLSSICLKNLYSTNVNNMNHMFSGCESLNSIDFSSFNTSNVIDMSSMFEKCSSIRNLDLSSFDTANVVNMSKMFSRCSKLNNVNLRTFNTSKNKSFSCMFSFCTCLLSLDLSSFDTSNAENMSYFFNSCKKLHTLDISSFNTSNVKSMCYMFFSCSNLEKLDISHFQTGNCVDFSFMFFKCPAVDTTNVSHFKISSIAEIKSMFD